MNGVMDSTFVHTALVTILYASSLVSEALTLREA